VILVDTSVWIKHFRQADPRLEALLVHELVAMHPFVLGELVCGTLKSRPSTIAQLNLLPTASLAPEPEVHHLIESRRLWGRGLGWVDVHLLASALVDHNRLWSNDRALAAGAEGLGIDYGRRSS
jgi:predicted nucleic acid-binding protein